ncbi:hypothetical protein ABZP36_003111 [Zizania latifolia]
MKWREFAPDAVVDAEAEDVVALADGEKIADDGELFPEGGDFLRRGRDVGAMARRNKILKRDRFGRFKPHTRAERDANFTLSDSSSSDDSDIVIEDHLVEKFDALSAKVDVLLGKLDVLIDKLATVNAKFDVVSA